MPGVHKAAGACAGLIVVELAAPEDSYFRPLGKGQGLALVAKEHAALGYSAAGKGRIRAGLKGFHKITAFLI